MKRIIDGKVYDTETATEIACDSYSSPGDFSYSCETLYKTKKGRYFMHGEGGPKSDYAESVGNNVTSGSSRMWTINEAEAQNFAAKHNPKKAMEIWSFEEG